MDCHPISSSHQLDPLVRDGCETLVVASLLLPHAEHLDQFAPETNGRINESCFVCINRRPLPNEIHFMRLEPLGLVDELPSDEEEGIDQDQNVVGEEIASAPAAGLAESAVAIGDNNDGLDNERDPGTVWLEVAGVWE